MFEHHVSNDDTTMKVIKPLVTFSGIIDYNEITIHMNEKIDDVAMSNISYKIQKKIDKYNDTIDSIIAHPYLYNPRKKLRKIKMCVLSMNKFRKQVSYFKNLSDNGMIDCNEYACLENVFRELIHVRQKVLNSFQHLQKQKIKYNHERTNAYIHYLDQIKVPNTNTQSLNSIMNTIHIFIIHVFKDRASIKFQKRAADTLCAIQSHVNYDGVYHDTSRKLFNVLQMKLGRSDIPSYNTKRRIILYIQYSMSSVQWVINQTPKSNNIDFFIHNNLQDVNSIINMIRPDSHTQFTREMIRMKLSNYASHMIKLRRGIKRMIYQWKRHMRSPSMARYFCIHETEVNIMGIIKKKELFNNHAHIQSLLQSVSRHELCDSLVYSTFFSIHLTELVLIHLIDAIRLFSLVI
jgi:hypothetical protein